VTYSNNQIARRTEIKVFFAGKDISKEIQANLLSLDYTDAEDGETDDLQIKIEDREGEYLEWLQQLVEASADNSVSATAEQSSALGTYSVTSPIGLNVRTGPGMQYSIIVAIPYGNTVEVDSIDSNGWAKIAYNGGAAYVYAQYIKPASGSSGATSTGSSGGSYEATCTYVDPSGNTQTGYLLNGKTYTDPACTTPVPAGSVVTTPDGNQWLKNADGSSTKVGSGGSSGKDTSSTRFSAVIVRRNWHGDGRDSVLDTGEFELDSVKAAGPPATITIKGTSLPYASSLRCEHKTKAWEAYKLSGIAAEMARNAGMGCMYLSSHDPYYWREEQYDKSDITFLQRLCINAGISLKCTNNCLVLFDQAGQEKTGSPLTITFGDGSYTKYSLDRGKADTEYQSCRVSYVDPATGKCIEGIAYVDDYDAEKEDNRQLEVTAKVKDAGEARALAGKRLRLYNKYAASGSFTLVGNPAVCAGTIITLVGFGMFDGKFVVEQAKHSVGSSGYTTTIKVRSAVED